MSKTKFAVIGASSMVGSRFCEMSKNKSELIKTDLNNNIKLDITDREAVSKLFEDHDFDWAIIFSGFTNVDEAEKQRGDKFGSCWQINVGGVENFAFECSKFNRGLIFISTDFVFDGLSGPYSEDDSPPGDISKVSWYGKTKLEAERIIKSQIQKYLILRIAYPYRARFEGKDDIVKRILRGYAQGNLYPMFSDQRITPTFIDDLAGALEVLLVKNYTGIFHLASPTTTSQYEFAKEVMLLSNGDPNLVREGGIVEYLGQPGVTPRPVSGGLKVNKIKNAGFTPTDWREGLRTIFSQSGGKLI